MATSLADLLDGIRPLAAGPVPTAADADCSVAALGHLSRALDTLTPGHQPGDSVTSARRSLATRELATTCRTASVQWPTAQGRLVDLAGAAADAIGRPVARLDTQERWALAIDVADAARRCAQFATRFVPYSDVPALRRVVRLTDVMRQLAVLDPPNVLARASLDAPIASPAVSLTTVTGRDAVDAAAGLMLALKHGTRGRMLTMRGVLAASAAAESCTAHAVGRASALGGQPNRPSAWSHAPDGWRVVQAALIRFEDGSRFASPTMSNLTERALTLHEAVAALTRHGPDSPPLADAATALRYVANQIPAIAEQIETAVTRWADTGRLFARARSLPHTEERVPELIRDHAVVVRPADIGAVLVSIRVAHRLSSALAVELDRSAGHVGTQPQPRLIRALATAAHLPNLDRDARWAGDLATRVTARSATMTPAR